MNLLLVEDNEMQQQDFIEASEDIAKKNNIVINLIACSNLNEAKSNLSNMLDGAIIDIRLLSRQENSAKVISTLSKGQEIEEFEEDGNNVVEKILEMGFKIPIIIFTGNPGLVDKKAPIVDVYAKADKTYADVIEKFVSIYNTGITKILGGKGKMEETLSFVFEKNIIPYLGVWCNYGNDNPERTEKALLRHTINHLIHLLDDDNEEYFREEFYITPPLTDLYRTGSILKKEEGDVIDYFIILSPACDVSYKNGNYKTDRFLVVSIDKIDNLITMFKKKPDDTEEKAKRLMQNSYSNNHHWLPKTTYFEGGVANFRKVQSYTLKELKQNFSDPKLQISYPFVKDILSRFSSYYARQGQPIVEMINLL